MQRTKYKRLSAMRAYELIRLLDLNPDANVIRLVKVALDEHVCSELDWAAKRRRGQR